MSLVEMAADVNKRNESISRLGTLCSPQLVSQQILKSCLLSKHNALTIQRCLDKKGILTCSFRSKNFFHKNKITAVKSGVYL